MFFRRLFHRLFPSRRVARPEDIPHLLSEDALARAMEEARTLRSHHRVDVQPLTPGEIPVPRRADSAH